MHILVKLGGNSKVSTVAQTRKFGRKKNKDL